jgi:flagellar basal body-associated protein FliL
MPEASTDIPPRTRQALRIIPLGVIVVLVVAAAAFAWSHLAFKGPGDHKDITAEQLAQGQTPATRDDYGAKDYVEPNKK